jgi:pilus assembly protein CpaE
VSGRRIVVGCGDPTLAHRVAAVVAELGHILVTVATTSADAAEAVSTHQPDVFVVADGLEPVPVLDLIRQVARHDPFVGVLLLSVSEDPELFRVAMEAGARSIAPDAFTVDDLGQRIETTAAWSGLMRTHLAGETARSEGAGHVVVLAGGKGGVGTTTIAVHVALEAAATGRRTCLVDLDLQTGDVAALLDITHRRDIADLIRVSDEITGQMLGDVLYRHQTGLEVLLATREGEQGEEVTEQVARMVLGALKSRFDVVVVDIGAVLTPAGAVAVQMADRAVVVGTPDVLSMRGARRVARMWDRLELRREGDLSLLLNRVSRHVEVQPELAARLARLPVEDVVIPSSFRALEAAGNTGDPARLVDRDVRRALARLALALGTRGAAPDPAPSRNAGRRQQAPHRGFRRGRPAAAPLAQPDSGQTAVELMGLTPVILVLLVCLIQGVLIGYSHVLAGHSAAAAARIGVSPLHTVAEIDAGARAALPQAWRRDVDVRLAGAGGGSDPRWSDPDAAVTVTLRSPALFPIADRLFGNSLLASSTAQMRFEGR